MAVNYCGRQLAQGLGWAAPAYHKYEGATPHPGACKFTLQYDGRPDERLGVGVGTWNLGSLSGKGGEVCEELRKRMIDIQLFAGGEMERAGCLDDGDERKEISSGGQKKEMELVEWELW